MVKSEVKLQKLYSIVSRNDDFVLYGAGDIGEILVDILKEGNRQPLYCVTTQPGSGGKLLHGTPIFCIDEKFEEIRQQNILVIVSVISKRHEMEIINTLHNYGITNIVLMTDLSFPFNAAAYIQFYKDKDYEWYLPRIKEWYFEQHGSELDIDSLYKESKEDGNKIVFVVENFSSRMVKFAKALKDSGKTVIVLLSGRTKEQVFTKFSNALQKAEVCTEFYGPVEELLFLLLKNKGRIIHMFSHPGFLYTAAVLIKLQSLIGKVVLDNYDIVNGFYTIVGKEDLEIEQYCIENASGVCYRESNIDILTDKLHFDIRGKTIRFYDYCSDEEYESMDKANQEELSICYAGGIDTEEEWPQFPYACYMEVALMCEKNQCHFHIYPSTWDEKRFKKYIEKDKESVYFHFHKPVPYDRLIQELSRYDYGICPVSDIVWEKKRSGYFTDEKYKCAGFNKYFDSLDAGLPIITAALQDISKYLEKKGVLINWTNGQYDFTYLREKKEVMQKRVAAVREELKIGNHIQELLEFYEML